ncbi:MAG: ATPase [Balneolaceae bacterium]|nr:MAG: ATPase [Balneolaceae bacterium]
MSSATVHVTKASGEKQEFDESKLRRSLARAGTRDELIDTVTDSVTQMLYDGIPTQRIYREAFRELKKQSKKSAGRYKLKEAILELGPTGYPFEKFVAELLNRMGYQTEVGVIMQGECVSHEIDVLATRENEYYMIECKFHNRKENTCNVKVPLYIQSRFLDLKKNWMSLPGHENKQHKGWIVTNTRFTSDAQTFGECAGLRLLSWDYPKNNGLKDLITQVGLHPVTSLSSLNKAEKAMLLDMDVIFCTQLNENPDQLKKIGMDNRKAARVSKEVSAICNSNAPNRKA